MDDLQHVSAADVLAACAAFQFSTPMPHQAEGIARMLDMIVYRRMHSAPVREAIASDDLVARGLARALAREPVHGMLLADGMGVGKTMQALATVMLYKQAAFHDAFTSEHTQPASPVLVCLNSALISVWQEQLERHFASVVNQSEHVFIYSGSDRLQQLEQRWSSLHFVFSTYETLRMEMSHFRRDTLYQMPWSAIIMDEVHKCRNGRLQSRHTAGSGVWQSLRRFHPHVFKLGCSGTLVCNNVMELCSISQIVFKNHSVLAQESFWSEHRDRFTPQVTALLQRTILLRRTLESLGIRLPPLSETHAVLTMQRWEVHRYAAQLQSALTALSVYQNLVQKHAPWPEQCQARQRYAAALNMLGLCVTLGGEQLSTKEIALLEHVRARKRDAGDVRQWVIVSRFVKVLQRIETLLREHESDLVSAAYTGELDYRQRGELVNAFRRREVHVLLLSSQAGAEGVDLTCAQDMILVDDASASNVFVFHDQVVARIFRIGQKKPTSVLRLIARGTIDQAYAEILHDMKRRNAGVMVDGDDDTFVDMESTASLLRRFSAQLECA